MKLLTIILLSMTLSACSIRMGNQHVRLPWNHDSPTGVGVTLLEFDQTCNMGFRLLDFNVGAHYSHGVCDHHQDGDTSRVHGEK